MGIYDSVVVTGGGGMLAHALGEALRQRGVQPALVTRAECDIADRRQVHDLFQRYKPTLLLNAAAHTKVDQCEDEPDRAEAINGQGVGYLAAQSGKYATKIIHFSTDFVFDGQSDRPYLTSDTPNPLSSYGRSKLFGEKAIQKLNPEGWLIVRTAWLYGGHGHCFPSTILNLARAGKPLKVVDDQIGCPTWTHDLAAVTLKLIDKNAQGIFHVTNDGITSWYGFAAAVLEEFQVRAELSPLTTVQWTAIRPKQAIRPRYSGLDCTATTHLIGIPLRPWRDALRKYRDEVGQAV